MIKNSRLHVGAFWRWDGSLAFTLGMVVVMVPSQAVGQAIQTDGRTATTVGVSGAVTDVRTSSLQGGNAFNSFATFNVPTATITNLHVPTNAANLINLVRDARSSIDGVLNAVKDGRIGGNVWFVNPYGLVVGAGGTVNLGSLNVVTPTPQYVNSFFLLPGLADPSFVTSLLSGTAPINPEALVSIQGKVNATDGVTLSAGTVSVGGTVFAGARFIGTAPNFTDVVNANGIASAGNVMVEAGRIRIVAAGDVTVDGTLATPGAAGVKAGEISLQAGGNIDLQAGAQLIARGNGSNSSGGSIVSWADNDAVNRAGSLLDASAGASGDGGFVEFSAKKTIELAGGELRADGTGGGAAGVMLIDPENINVTANMLRGASSFASGASGSGITVNGADLTLLADKSITIAANTVISSRSVAAPNDVLSHQSGASTASSGNITLEAPNIVLHSGSALLAHASTSFSAGDITLTAEQHTSSNLMGVRDATASIQIGDAAGGATLRGRTVSLNASTTVDTKFYYTGDALVDGAFNFGVVDLDQTALATQATSFGLSLVGINVVHSQSTGTASVVVQGTAGNNSVIEGTEAVSLLATNNVSSGVTTAAPSSPGAQVATPLGLGALYATTRANATVDVQSTATIKGGNFSAVAHNDASVEGTIKGGSGSSSSNQLAIAFGYTSADVDANATIARGATIKSTGTVTLAATNYSKLTNTVESVTGPNGVASAAVAWSDHNTSAIASLGADIGDAKQVQVLAVDHTLMNKTTATASAGVGASDAVMNAAKQKTVQGLEDLLWKRFGLETQKIDQKASPIPTPFRIGGAISYVESVHSALAIVGDDAKIHASDTGNSGAVIVAARTLGEKTIIAAEAQTSSPSIKTAATPSSGSPSLINVAAGLAIGNFSHNAGAVIGSNTEITADKIAVTSDVKLPIRPSVLFGNAEWNFDRWDGLETFSEAANTLNFLDVMNGMSSAAVSSSSEEDSFGFSGSANLLSFTHTSQAEVREGAKLNIRSGSSGAFSSTFTLRDATADTYDLTNNILLFRGDPADVQSWSFSVPVTIEASTDSTLLFQAGAPQLSTSSSNKAIGFSLSQIQVTSNNEALVREGAVIRGVTDSAGTADADGMRTWTLSSTDATVDDVRINALSSEKVFSFGANAGKASSGGNPVVINGIVTLVNVDNKTTASVDNEATIAARKLAITSTDGTVAWSIAGAVNLSSSTAVGIALGINDVTTDTRAEIADNDSYSLTADARDSQGLYVGSVKASDLDVEARTSGRVEAIGIAGSVSNSSNTPPGEGFFDKVGAVYSTATSALTTSILGLSPEQPTRERSNATSTKPAAAAPPTFGLSGAGSAAVNITDMKTNARIESSSVEMSAVLSTPATLTVRAVSDSDITTASGSAAITRAGNTSQTRAVGISGAISVNMIGNGTEAIIKDAQISGAKDVSVQALTGGEQLSVAIGAAITQTPVTQPSQSSLAVAGSVSITLSRVDDEENPENYAKARIENSVVTGDNAADAALHVTAYSRTFIGTGGGALSVGSKSGVGAAVTFSDVRSDVDAMITGSTINQFQTATIEAYNATEIGAGGAVLAASDRQDANALGGAFVLTQVQNRTHASITANSSVTVAGQIDVLAKDSGADNALETLIDPSNERENVAPGLDYCGRQAGIGASPSGSCITSVAGVVQANTGGQSSNVGISFVQNLIGNTVSAKVENSLLNATGTSGTVNVEADSSTHMLGLALGAASADKFSGAGSVVVSQTENNVSASVTAPAANATYSTVTAKTINVIANDGSSIDSVAGQVVNSGDQTAIGAAISYNDINNKTSAKAEGVVLNAADALQIEAAQRDAAIRSLAVAGALASGQGAFTASISVNQITNQTEAALVNASTSDGMGGTNQVKVWAHDDSSIQALAGSVAVGKQAGGGAAFAYNAIDNKTLSQVMTAQVTEASQLEVLATQSATIQALTAAVGASGSGSALSGSVSTNFISNNTTAELISTGITGSTADVTVQSNDTSEIEAVSGDAVLAVSGTSVGIAASINRIANTADAHVSGVADANLKNLRVDARSDATIETIAAAMSVASSLGAGGSNATNLMDNTTRAYISGGARVLAENNVGVFAHNEDRVKVIAGASGISLSALGAGVSVVVNMMSGSTDAYIDGASTQVDARGMGPEKLQVNNGELKSTKDLNSVLIPSDQHANLEEKTLELNGLAVTATSHQSAITNAATLGLGKTAGISLVPVVNIMGGITQSAIKNAQIGTRLTTFNSPEVYVNASSHAYTAAFAIGASGSAGGAASAAAVTNLLERKTSAYTSNATIGGLAVKTEQISSVTQSEQAAAASASGDIAEESAAPVINETITITQSRTLAPTLGNVRVQAKASQSAANIAAGFAVGAGAVVGTGVVNRFSADTQAYVVGGAVSAQSLAVDAKTTSGYNALAGAGAGGVAGGAAASLVVGIANNSTKAWVGDPNAISNTTQLRLTGNLDINADTSNSMNSVVVSGAGGGGAGIAGMADITLLDNTTVAGLYRTTAGDTAPLTPVQTQSSAAASSSSLDNTTNITTTTNTTTTTVMLDRTGTGQLGEAMGSVNVVASENVDIDAKAGALALGGTAGVGAGANIVIVKSQVTAEVKNSTLTTPGAVGVSATTVKDITMFTAAAAVGSTAGIGGAVGVLLVGDGTAADASQETDKDGNGTLTAVNNYSSATPTLGSDTGLTAGEASRLTSTRYNVAAAVGSDAKDAVTAKLDASTISAGSVSINAAGAVSTSNTVGAGGAGTVGISGAVGYTRVYDNIIAAASNSTLNAASVTVSALMRDHTAPLVSVKSYVGALGLVGISANVADGIVNNTVSATLGGTVTGGAGVNNTVTVSAQDLSSINTEGLGLAGGAAAVGVSVAIADKSSAVSAQTLASANVTQYKTAIISASESGAVSSVATAAAGGLVSGTGAGATAFDRASVMAQVNGTLAASNAVNISASATPTVSATARGVAVGGFSVGASVALASAAPTVTASVADGAVVNGAGSLAVTASVLVPSGGNSVKAYSLAGSGGTLVGATATVSRATSDATVRAFVGDGTTLPAGDLKATARNDTKQVADTTGIAVGYVALGANVAESVSSGVTEAWLGAGVVTAAGRTGDVSVIASGVDDNTAEAVSGAGGVFAGNAATATTRDTATTKAWLAGGGTRTTLYAGNVLVNASHQDRSGRSVTSVNASVAGASGAVALHEANSTVVASLGDNLTVNALGVAEVETSNTFTEDRAGDTASGAAGGVISGAAAISRTNLSGSTSTLFGNNVQINSGTDYERNKGGIKATASTEANANDKVTLSTGGAITGAGTESTYVANFNNQVLFGTQNQLKSQGDIGAGTWTVSNVSTAAQVNTWGLASVGFANATTDITANQRVDVGASTTMEAFGNVNVTAGMDPLGSYDTALRGDSNAQGYVRGLIAVPGANASTRLAGNSEVTVANGAHLKSGQNVKLGAYKAAPSGTSSAEGRGYQLGFIPVTSGDSNVSTPLTSTVNFNGAITAGVYHKLDISINDNTLSFNPDAAPFLFSYDSAFHAPTYIDANYSAAQAQLLKSGVSGNNVVAFKLGSLYASGGTATINADAFTGNGTVTSYGSPTISVVNNTANYLVLDTVKIPYLPGGKVIFTGAVNRTQAQSAGLTVSEIGGTASPAISIDNAYPVRNVSTGQAGPALFLGGEIENLGGSVKVNNSSGLLGQSSTIYGQQVNITVPNGPVVVDSGFYYAGGNPYSEWQEFMIWPGGNPALGVPDPTLAMTYVINAIHNSNGQYKNEHELTTALISNAGSTNNISTVYFGNCYFAISGDCSAATADRLSVLKQHHDLTGYGGSFAKVPVQILSKKGNYANAALAGSQNSSSIFGGQVSILADTIDLNGKITAGQPTQWSLKMDANLGATLADFKYLFDLGHDAVADYKIAEVSNSTTITRAGDSQITATYNALTNEITVDDIKASSGGGYVGLTGRIISTNTLGNIHVTGGLGDVQIVNNTGLNLNLNKINTGNMALAAALTSEVEIIDKNRDASANHTLYRYTPGTGLLIYSGAESQTINQLISGGNRSAVVGSSATTFQPAEGMRWEWKQTANLTRPADGNWTFTGNQNLPWTYTNEAGGDPTTTPQGYLKAGSTETADFVQKIDASRDESKIFAYGVRFNGCDDGFCNYGFLQNATAYKQENDGRARWQFQYPTDATLTLTSSIKASNPVAINFSGNERGSVAVSSNASVVINNALINPNGATTISTSGDIRESDTGSVLTSGLNLTAQGGIGSVNRPLVATLTDDSELSAVGGSQGVYLALNSAAKVKTVRSQTGQTYGDVVIKAANALTSVTGVTPSVVGNNITLSSTGGSVGSQAAPLTLNARASTRADGLVSGGVVNVTALNEVAITQTGGDLFMGSIESQAGGDVFINVPNGTIYGAAGQTSSQALSADQVRRVWQDLQLTAAYGAETGLATDASVVRFQNQVNSNYQQYWRLLDNGTVSGTTFVLAPPPVVPTGTPPPVMPPTGIELYRPLAAAALGLSNPSDAQTQDYANAQYQSVTRALDSLLGADWTSVVGTSAMSSFAYTATSGQVAALTDRALWTEAELNASIRSSALQPGTPVGIGAPHITGRNITLATSGAIGKLAAPELITLANLQSGALTTNQVAALALANVPGTVTPVDATGAPVASGVIPHAFLVQQTAPVFVNAAGTFTANAGGVTFVQSTAQNITLDKITAGGNVSVAAPQSILSSGSSATQIQTPGDVTLLAGSGSIGSASSPLSIQAGRLLAASAGQDAYIRGMGGNLTFGRVATGGMASLTAVNGSLVSYLDGVVVDGSSISLNALNDVGSFSRYVQVRVDEAGTLGGTAGGSAYLEGPSALTPLNIGTYSADAGLYIAAAGDLTAQQLQSSYGAVSVSAGGNADIAAVNDGISTANSGDVTLTAVKDLSVGSVTNGTSAVSLLAGEALTVTGSVAIASGAISASGAVVDIAGELVSATGAITVNATGNVHVNHIASGKTNAQAVTITSTAGRIVESGSDSQADIVANGTGALVTLSARDGIGDTTTPNALEIQVANLDATSLQGGIYLDEADALSISSVTARGPLQLTVGAALTGTLVQSTTGTVDVSATTVDLMTVSAAESANLKATTGHLQVGSASAGGLLRLQGQTGIETASLVTSGSGGITATTATGDLRAAQVVSADAVALTASTGSVLVDTVQGQNDVTLMAGQGIAGRSTARYDQVQSVAGRVNLQAQAGDITGNRTLGEGDMQVTANRNVDLDTTQSVGGSVLLTASTGNLTASTTSAQVNADLRAGGAIAVGDVIVATGNASLRAQGDIRGDLLSAVAGDVTVDSVNGEIDLSRIAGGGVLLYAKDAIKGEQFEVGRRLVLVSNSVDATVQHTSNLKPLQVTLTGRQQPVMSQVDLTLNTEVGVRFDRFWATNGNLQQPIGTLEIVDGYIGNRLRVTSDSTQLLIDNSAPSVQNPYDVQLYARTKAFDLFMDRNTFRTLAADIIHRNDISHTVLSESTGLDSSVAEQSVAENGLSMRLLQPAAPVAPRTLSPVLNFSGNPVLLTDPGPSQNGNQNDEEKAP